MRLIGLVILAVSLTLSPLAGEAQQAGKVWRVGVLELSESNARAHLHGAEDRRSSRKPYPDIPRWCPGNRVRYNESTGKCLK